MVSIVLAQSSSMGSIVIQFLWHASFCGFLAYADRVIRRCRNVRISPLSNKVTLTHQISPTKK